MSTFTGGCSSRTASPCPPSARRILAPLADRHNHGRALLILARIHHARGRITTARGCLLAAEDALRQVGAPQESGHVAALLADLALAAGDHVGAVRHNLSALDHYRTTDWTAAAAVHARLEELGHHLSPGQPEEVP